MAPNWISTAKVLPKSSSSKPKKRCISRRCPVEDTGRNSVRPSTTPRTNALTRSNVISGSAAGGETGAGVFRPRAPAKGRGAFPASSTLWQRKRPTMPRGLTFPYCGGPSLQWRGHKLLLVRRPGNDLAGACAIGTDGTDSISTSGMLTLFHHPFCPHSRFVRLVLGEYGLEARLIEERTWERRHDFLAINPAGTTPVLVDEGQPPVPGAPVVAEYLDEVLGSDIGDRRLLPREGSGRVEVRRLMSWFNDKFFAEISEPLTTERFYKRHMSPGLGGGSPDTD